MIESDRNPRRWRDAATLLLAVVLAVSVVSVVLDGGRSALAADDCQYGQYGQYGPYGPYGPYGSSCPKARPTLRVSAPSSAGIGTSVVPVAILENGDNPTGTLIVRLHRPGQQCASPSQPPFWLAQVEVHGNGAYSASLPFGPPPPFDQLGTWIWSATYVGDARNELTHTICGAFTTNVTKRNPGLSLTNWTPAPYEPGVFAVVRGEFFAYQPSSGLTLALHGPGDADCTGTPAFVQSVTTSTFEAHLGPLGVGTWRLRATYPGDTYNLPLDSGCSPWVIVSKRSASLAPSISAANVTVGQPVAAGASVLGSSPTGTLTVRLFAPTDPACSSPVAAETLQVSGSGPVTASFVPTSVGTWRVTSEYSGDANNTSATTACDATAFAAQKATPMPSVTAVPGLAEDGDRIHARVDLGSAYRPTGRVSFSLFPPNDSSCSGAPTYVEEVVLTGTGAATSGGFEVPKHAVGTWNWTASYAGDENNAHVASTCGQAPVEVVKKIKKEK